MHGGQARHALSARGAVSGAVGLAAVSCPLKCRSTSTGRARTARRHRESRQGCVRQRVSSVSAAEHWPSSSPSSAHVAFCWQQWASQRHRPQGCLWRDARCGLQAWREHGVVSVSVQKIKSRQALDDVVDGSSVRGVVGSEQADEFAGTERSFTLPTNPVWPVWLTPNGRARGGHGLVVPAPWEVLGLLGVTRKRPRRPWRGAEPLQHASEWYEDRWRCSKYLVVRPAGRCGGRSVQVHCTG